MGQEVAQFNISGRDPLIGNATGNDAIQVVQRKNIAIVRMLPVFPQLQYNSKLITECRQFPLKGICTRNILV